MEVCSKKTPRQGPDGPRIALEGGSNAAACYGIKSKADKKASRLNRKGGARCKDCAGGEFEMRNRAELGQTMFQPKGDQGKTEREGRVCRGGWVGAVAFTGAGMQRW